MLTLEQILNEFSFYSKNVLYHGTDNSESGKGILKSGTILIPTKEIFEKKYHYTNKKYIPQKNKIYLTQSLAIACFYALGGNFFGKENPPYKPGSKVINISGGGYTFSTYGYVFSIDQNSLKDCDIKPDEDHIGALLSLYMNNNSNSFDGLNVKGKNLDWLVDLAKKHLTQEQWKKQTAGTKMIDWITTGKKLTKYLTKKQSLELIDCGANIASDCDVKITHAWEIDKRKSKLLNPDLSNFFQIAKQMA